VLLHLLTAALAELSRKLPLMDGHSSALKGPVLYLDFGGLLGGWQEPQGLLFVTIFGVASVCPEVKVSAAPAISNTAAIPDAHATNVETWCIHQS
jgi:hypothetical protein